MHNRCKRLSKGRAKIKEAENSKIKTVSKLGAKVGQHKADPPIKQSRTQKVLNPANSNPRLQVAS